jgi:hypothetical protein
MKKKVIEVIEEVVVDKNPLHTKYAKFIEQAKDGYLTGFDYPSAMEILRYCETKRGVQMGLNMNCPTCLFQLIKMFDSLRN